MNKILVPTDFSEEAGYAGDAAIQLAPLLKAEVHFFSRTPGKREGKFFVVEPGDTEAPLGITEKFQALREKYSDFTGTIRTFYSHNSLITAIEHYVEEEKISLVIMGSSGADGIKALLLGSHAQKVVNRVEAPVIVIKHPREAYTFKNIVFASDFRKEARKPFLQLADLARQLNAHLHLVHVVTIDTTPVEEYLARKKMQEFEKNAEGLKCSTHFSGDFDVELGVKHYADEKGGDLIAVISHGEGPLQRLVKGGSIAESMVMRLEIPVLTLNAATQ